MSLKRGSNIALVYLADCGLFINTLSLCGVSIALDAISSSLIGPTVFGIPKLN